VTPSQPGNVRDDLMRGRSLHWLHWLVVAGVLAVTGIAWRSSGQPAILAVGVLFGGLLLASYVELARANRRALRYADLDSSELRIKNERLAYAREVALAANRSKDQFLTGMGHELRTPLNTVIGLTEAMLQGQLGAEERGHAQVVLEASESLLATIEDMLDLARIDAEKLSFESVTFDLYRTIGDALNELAVRARDKGLELRRNIDPAMERIRVGDPKRLRQVIQNLLRNAIEFTEAGKVEIVAGNSSGGADGLRVEVRDTGVGIDPERRGLFEVREPGAAPSARRSGGAGLGLPICKRLVEQMGGQIGVENRPGGGSTFWFTVRLAAGEADAAPEPAIPHCPLTLPKRLLLVEDSLANQRVALAILGPEPEVVIAANGREACDRLAERDFDVILMDVEMPEMNGLEATAEIRAREAANGRHTPIVAMTAHAHADDRRLCLAAGMDGYVSKPVRRDELLGAIGQALDGASAATRKRSMVEPAQRGR